MTNCEKHERLIVTVLDVDTTLERPYCIDCIVELEEQLAQKSEARCDNDKCGYCDYLR